MTTEADALPPRPARRRARPGPRPGPRPAGRAARAAGVLAALAGALASAGCATRPDPAALARSVSPFSSPAPSLQDRIDAMRAGRTSRADALARLGGPAAQARADDGSELLWWEHFEGGLSPVGLLPVANAILGAGESVRVRSLLVFGPDELLREVRQERRRIDGRVRDPDAAARPAVPWGVPR